MISPRYHKIADSLELILLGTGTCVPTGRRGPSAYAILHDDQVILLEMGGGCLEKLARAGVSYLQVDTVILSHFHVDHTSELPLFLFANNYGETAPRDRDLTILGPPGLDDFLGRLENLYRWVAPKEYKINLLQGEGTFSLPGNIGVKTITAEHDRGNALSIRLETPGKSLTYSGDTGYHEGIVSLAKETDLLLIECSHSEGREDKVEGHLTPLSSARIAKKSRAKKTVLTHLYPEAEKSDPLLSFRRHAPHADVHLGEDYMRFTL